MLVSPLSIEQVLHGIPVEAIETAQHVALEQLHQYLAKLSRDCNPNQAPPNGEQMEQFAETLYDQFVRSVGGSFRGHALPDWDTLKDDLTRLEESNAWRQVAMKALSQVPGQELPKLIIVDLYGDGDTLRIIPDTPENEKAVRDFDTADKAAVAAPGDKDTPDFSDFISERGVPMFITRWIELS